MNGKSYENSSRNMPHVTQLECGEHDSLLMRDKSTPMEKKSRPCTLILMVVVLPMLVVAFDLSNGKLLFHPSSSPPDADDLAEQAIQKLDNLTRVVQQGQQPSEIPDGCESSVIIIRHCDDLGGLTKSDDGSVHCSPIGEERSHYLASLFEDNYDNDDNKTRASKITSRWPMPKLLYAMNTNERQVVTLTPLAQKANLTIEEFPSSMELQSMHFDRLSSQLCHGEITVAAWRHHYIADLAVALGCGPNNGCPQDWDDMEFDSVWEIRYLYVEDDGWHVYGSVTREYFDPIEYEHEHLGE